MSHSRLQRNPTIGRRPWRKAGTRTNTPKHQAKKQLDAGFRKLKDLKARMANALAAVTDILSLCQKGPKWEWVSGKTSESLQKVLCK